MQTHITVPFALSFALACGTHGTAHTSAGSGSDPDQPATPGTDASADGTVQRADAASADGSHAFGDGAAPPDIAPDSQTVSVSNFLVAQAIADRSVLYDLSQPGDSKPITWGLDLAWLSETNIRRGVAFMGADRVDVVRSSFKPTDPIVNDALTGQALSDTNQRIAIIKNRLGSNTQVVLNSDSPSTDASLKNNAAHWAQLIDVTMRYHQNAGLTVIGVSPLNEPDYSANGQGSMSYFDDIDGQLRGNARFDGIRISGGNTLSPDAAQSWYDYLEARLDEGNTHQLAGSFDSFAAFFAAVRADGKHASDDELHNVMEAMVGVQYGLQTGIWWGTAELARGEFVKASDGTRLGYAEHRPNWTAASVYRGSDGRVQAFAGTSERQAATTSYRFVSLDRDVYYDGQGPQREYVLTMPGGTGYQQGQTNAERVLNVSAGDDIQPVIDGRYVLINRNSHKLLDVAHGTFSAGANLVQSSAAAGARQQWDVHPVDPRIGGDFSYLRIQSVASGLTPDVLDFSLEAGARVIAYTDSQGVNQQWFLEYVEDGWFHVRSRNSAQCLGVANASLEDGANVVQSVPSGAPEQQWRLLPADAPVEFDAPSAPAALLARGNAASVLLRWTASPDADVTGYEILRATASGGPYATIARAVPSTSFVDNTAASGIPYFYVVKSADGSLNRSTASNEAAAASTDEHALLAHLAMDQSTLDDSPNLNHGASAGTANYQDGKVGTGALSLNGSSDFVQLPSTLAHHDALTVAAWVYWNGGTPWQRIFDFGVDIDSYLFLTPSSGDRTLRLAVSKSGTANEQRVETSALPVKTWTHVAVTLDAPTARLYVDGQQVAESNAVDVRPSELPLVSNYLGRSQFPDPLFSGAIDDFKVFNYALDASEVGSLAQP